MQERVVVVPAIHCGQCTRTIQTELADLDGVESVVASTKTQQVTVRFGPPADWKQIEELLIEIGFPPAPAQV
jgi:copper chaperone CopZ